MTDLVIVGDEAWTLKEWEAKEREREYRREYRRRPEVRAMQREYLRRYRARPGAKEKHREYNRRWMAKKRAAMAGPEPVGYLHSLSCASPHWRARKHCTPIPVYSKKQDVAA